MTRALERVDASLRAPVFSIGVYSGPAPWALSPVRPACNPVLTRGSVADGSATFVADPFMIRVDGTWFMFFEVMGWRRGSRKKGEIALATSSDAVRWTYRQTVLSEPFHMSYPYVFEHGSDFYMIPECRRSGAVRLYRADPFPARWQLVKTLLSGPFLLDTSLFRHEGRWWMLTETGRAHDTLRLFQASELTGPWREHPRSPVVRGDARLARPAGRVVATPDRLVRFAQDCRSAYGTSVHALEITRLGPRDYGEAEIGGAPVVTGSGEGWNRDGMHHVDAHRLSDGSWIACVDGWATRPKMPRELFRAALERLAPSTRARVARTK